MLAAVIGVAAVAFREGGYAIAAIVFGVGLLAWLAFFLMDYVWYHRLLRGAIKYGQALELRLQELAGTAAPPAGGLTEAISKSSGYTTPDKWWLFKLRNSELRSNDKMQLFYKLFALPLVIGLVASVAIGIIVSSGPEEEEPAQLLEATVTVQDTVILAVPSALIDAIRTRLTPAVRDSPGGG